MMIFRRFYWLLRLSAKRLTLVIIMPKTVNKFLALGLRLKLYNIKVSVHGKKSLITWPAIWLLKIHFVFAGNKLFDDWFFLDLTFYYSVFWPWWRTYMVICGSEIRFKKW